MGAQARGAPRPDSDTSLPPLYDQSWALIIGVDDYGGQFTRLRNAENDARGVATLLKTAYDFADDHVCLLLGAQATRDAIMEWLRDRLPERVGANDRLVIFFAGHGITRESGQGLQRGYLIPFGARRGRYSDYVDMVELQDACGWIPAKHILIILDCCFSGIAAVASRGEPSMPPRVISEYYLRRITERPAWQVLTAGDTDDLAADSGLMPGHSAFTSALILGLNGAADQNDDGIITASELAGYVRPEVTAATQGRQSPFFNYLRGSGQGDFVFARPDQPLRLARDGALVSGVRPLFQAAPWLYALTAAFALIILSLVGLVWDSYTRLNAWQATATSVWATVQSERATLNADRALAVATADMLLAAQTAQAIVHQVTATAVANQPAPTQTRVWQEAFAADVNFAIQQAFVEATLTAVAPRQTAIVEKAQTAESNPAVP